MRKLCCFLLFSIILFSCSNSERFTSSGFELQNESGKVSIAVSKNGLVTVRDQVVGAIKVNGTIYNTSGGLLATLTSTNILIDKEGDKIIEVDEEGTISDGPGIIMQWNDEGEFLDKNSKTGMQMVPVDEDSFQTASCIIAVYLAF